MSYSVSTHNKKRERRRVRKKHLIPAKPCLIIDSHVWHTHMDPIDRDIYTLLSRQYAKDHRVGTDSETLLRMLKQASPKYEYTVIDVWHSLDKSLSLFVKKVSNRHYALRTYGDEDDEDEDTEK